MNFFHKRSRWAVVKKKTRHELKQELAAPDRFYGDDGTIHRTIVLDVETHNGKVVSVWFRCMAIAFEQCEVSESRAREMGRMTPATITGIQVSQ